MSALPKQYEKELLCQVAKGDEAAFTLLFNAYHQQLGAYIYRLTESFSLTEEIVQDVFLRIWLKRMAMQDVERFDAYLFTAARNHTFNCLKKIARERSSKLRWEMTLSEEPMYEMEAGADPAIGYRALLDEAVEKLPLQQKKVYLLHRRQGLSHAEIARRLDLSVETVKKHMTLALRSIRNYLSPRNRHADLLLLLISLTLIIQG
jgi:RNA polymerase sigma-70 factor (family 1)